MATVRPQFSLRFLLVVVVIAAVAAWAVHEHMARRRAELRAARALAESQQAKQLAAELNVTSIAINGDRVYLWDVRKGSVIAISRSKRLILWESVLGTERYPGVTPISPPHVEGNFVYLTDTDGNRRMVLDARTGEVIEVR